MKKLFTFLLFCTYISVQAQVLYTENFNGVSTFTLNTTDQSSTAAGYNFWVINNSYSGGSVTPACLGFPISITSTSSQPGAITGSPNSKYMHILDTEASSQGVTNANFHASDANLFCVGDENYFTKMSGTINTTGYTGITLSFWWLCAGSASETYGELYYSTDGGGSWNLQGGSYNGQSSWTQATLTNSLWDNQASLKFGFRFVNSYIGGSAADPSFSIDEISVYAPVVASITTANITGGSPFCAGDSLVVPYTISGSFSAGNIFTAQLSDASGSFASPVNIGSVSSTLAGNINCQIPAGTAAGTNYAIRVVGSNPATTGTSSGPITIHAMPVASASNTGPYCKTATIQLNSLGGLSYLWFGPLSFGSGAQNPTINNSSVAMSGVYSVTVTDQYGCTATATTTVAVNDCAGIEDEETIQVNVYPNPTSDLFTVSLNENIWEDAKITLFNLVGQTVYSITPNQSKIMISTESLNLNSGIYLIQIKYKGQTKVVRIIVR